MGCARHLREHSPGVIVAGVEPEGSGDIVQLPGGVTFLAWERAARRN